MSENNYLNPNRAKELNASADVAGRSEIALLCCPFCGSTDLYPERLDLSETAIMCNDCGIHGPGGCPEDDKDLEIEEKQDLYPGTLMAKRRWNKRAT